MYRTVDQYGISIEISKKGEGLLELSNGPPKMWRSLNSLKVKLRMDNSHRESDFYAWGRVCTKLGAYSRPSHLELRLILWYGARAGAVLRSMQTLPVLKNLAITIYFRDLAPLGVHHLAASIINRQLNIPTCQSTQYHSHFRFMDLPTEIQITILKYTDLIAPSPVVACMSCIRRGPMVVTGRHISTISTEIFFSCNKFVVDVGHMHIEPAIPLWISGRDPSRKPGVWSPDHSAFLPAFPPASFRFLRFLTWRFSRGSLPLTKGLEADWISTIEFISQNVPLARLTIGLVMPSYADCSGVVVPLQKLQGLRGLFVRLLRDFHRPLVLGWRAAEELRLVRLAIAHG
ncbi:hypothetical protein V8E54_007492 [Elaphomyces granulatus]